MGEAAYGGRDRRRGVGRALEIVPLWRVGGTNVPCGNQRVVKTPLTKPAQATFGLGECFNWFPLHHERTFGGVDDAIISPVINVAIIG